VRTGINRTLTALADPTRRWVVEQLRRGPGRAGALAADGGLSAPALSRHPELGFRSPLSLGGSPVLLLLNVPDVDAMVARAVDAGGRLTRPVENHFYGSRTGEITDPFGYRWYLSTHVEDVSEPELMRRAAERERARRG
jgi:PhnB protein